MLHAPLQNKATDRQRCLQVWRHHGQKTVWRLQVVSASSDGTVRVWDGRTCEVVLAMKPPQTAAGGEPAVASVMTLPQNADHLLVVPRTSTACIMTLKGQVSAVPQPPAKKHCLEQGHGLAAFGRMVAYLSTISFRKRSEVQGGPAHLQMI